MGLQDLEPKGPGVVGIEQLEQGEGVAERLAHLFPAVGNDHAGMGPAPGEGAAGGYRLGPLVLVVGEGQILAAPVEVEPVAEQVQGHDHALGMPARPARPPRRVPARLTRLGRLPEGEVDRGSLPGLLSHFDPGADTQALDGLAGQQAVARHALGAK